MQNTSCIRKPQAISGGGAHPLHPPPRSASVTFVIFPLLHWLLSCHFICHFPALRSLLFPHITFVIFPPFCLLFFCHCVRLFPAILFVIFPPLCFSISRHCVRQSSLSRCSRHYILQHFVISFVTFLPVR